MTGAAASAVAAPAVVVRRLALAAPRREDVVPFRNDLEDALRTASYPGLPRGAVLHVRRLVLGRVPRGLSRQALAALVAARLGESPAELLAWGRAPGDPEGAAPLALLPDPVTATALALQTVLQGRRPHWALDRSFPGLPWQDPPAAVAALIDRLIAGSGDAAPGRLISLSGGDRLLLAALAAVPEPALARWIALAAGEGAGHPIPTGPAVATAPPPHTGQGPIGAAAGDPRRLAIDADSLPAPMRSLLAAALRLWPPRSSQLLAAAALAGRATLGPVAAASLLARLARPEPRAASAATQRGRPGVVPTPRPGHPPDPDRPSEPAAPAHRPAGLAPAAPAPPPETARLADLVATPDLAGLPSAAAGLWLLLPVLRLVGVEAAGQATGLPLGHALLRRFAGRLGLGEGDPAAPLLAECPLLGPPDPAALWSPHASVLAELAGGGALRLRHRAPGRAALGLPHGPGGLAQLDATGLAALRAQRLPLRVAPGRSALTGQDIVAAQALACQRLIRRLTGRGWRALLARPGRVCLTPTHLDITFDGRLADPAVRRAGLDFDPGWLQWLGRVVSFHYDYSILQHDIKAGHQP